MRVSPLFFIGAPEAMATYNTEDSKKLLSTSFKGSGARKRHLLACRIKSMFKGGAYEAVANNLETLCLFIGYPRSGHSLVVSLLDAHPEMINKKDRRLKILCIVISRNPTFKIYGEYGKDE